MGRPVLLLVLSLLILGAALGDDLSRCPTSLIRNQYLRTFRDHCYEFVIYRETYWDMAQSECAHKGGHLVTVRDMATQQFLMQTLTSLNFKKHGIWIGMDDRNSESHFVWVSGEVTHFSYWAPGEPSVLHRLEDCVLMKSSKSYHWEDHACHLWPQHYTYICEYAMTSLLSTTVTTPSTTVMTQTTTVTTPLTTVTTPTTTVTTPTTTVTTPSTTVTTPSTTVTTPSTTVTTPSTTVTIPVTQPVTEPTAEPMQESTGATDITSTEAFITRGETVPSQ